MSSSIRARIEKLEVQPRAPSHALTVWQFSVFLRTQLSAVAKGGNPSDRVLVQEVVIVSKQRSRTLADLSTPALYLLRRLLEPNLLQRSKDDLSRVG